MYVVQKGGPAFATLFAPQASKKQLEDLQQPNDDPLLAEPVPDLSSSESTLVTPSRRCDSELDETPEKVDQMAGAQGQGEAGPDDETIPATDVEDLLQKLDTVATLPETNESSESAWPSDWHDAQSRRSPTLSPLREDDPYVIAFSDSGEEDCEGHNMHLSELGSSILRVSSPCPAGARH